MEVAKHSFGRSPVFVRVAPSPDEAGEDADGVGKVGAGAHHGVHEGANECGVGVGGGDGLCWWCELMAEFKGGGDWAGAGHVEAGEDVLKVELLRKGDGAGGTVPCDGHAQVVFQLPKILAGQMCLKVALDLCHLRYIIRDQDHIVNVDKDVEAGWGGTDEQVDICLGGGEPEGVESGSEFVVPFPRCLFEAVDWATEVPDSVGGEWLVKPLGSFQVDLFIEYVLEKGIGDIHAMDDHVEASRHVEDGADGGKFGRGGKSVPIVDGRPPVAGIRTGGGFTEVSRHENCGSARESED
ncbi:hypothetical protein CLOP_g1940 [Closterium sp. NIES-67]|nr:hypothetical protein CLOP_g1940 [Closterium sp. NIES-67]